VLETRSLPSSLTSGRSAAGSVCASRPVGGLDDGLLTLVGERRAFQSEGAKEAEVCDRAALVAASLPRHAAVRGAVPGGEPIVGIDDATAAVTAR
jgi:hypothetical protein